MGNVYGFSDFDKAFLTKKERDTITAFRQNAEKGLITWAEANKGAEAIRGKYGYAGGSDGSKYILQPQSINTEYNGGAAQQKIDAQAQKLDGMTYEKFTEGSEYAALLDKYTKAGSRAMEDTVGTVAGRTGGMASSYAQTAGQQAFNQYMEGLDDAGKDLYMQEYEKERQRLADMRTQEQQDYSRFLDTVALAKDERQYRQDVGRTLLDDQRYDEERADSKDQQQWQRGVTEAGLTGEYKGERTLDGQGVDFEQWLQKENLGLTKEKWDYAKGQDDYEKRAAVAELLAGYGDFSGFKELFGLTDEQAARLGELWQADWNDSHRSTSGGSGGGGGMTLATAKAMAKAGQLTDEVVNKLLASGYNMEYLESEYGYTGENDDDTTVDESRLPGDIDGWAWSFVKKFGNDAEKIVTGMREARYSDQDIDKVLAHLGY